MIPKRPKDGSKKPESPIEARKRELAEREAKTREEIEKCERDIQEAPQRAANMARARREQLISRAARTETRTRTRAALPDRWRIAAGVSTPLRHSRLRAERRQGRLLFFALLLVTLVLGYYVYYTIMHP